MFEELLAGSALPNLHPAVVHFPIALLITAFGFDLAALALRSRRWLDKTATSLYVLGAVAAGVTYLTGDHAAEGLKGVRGTAQAAIYDHADAALITLLAFIAIAILRLIVVWRDRTAARTPIGALRIVVVILALAGLAQLARTADMGGALVYRHGISVATPSPVPGIAL